MKKKKIDSRQKGKRGELQARDQVRAHWGSSKCIRAAQANGSYSADLLNALPGAHVEVKYLERIGCFRFLEQAERDKSPEEFPVLLMKETGTNRWLVAFPIEDTEEFVSSYWENQQREAERSPPTTPTMVRRDQYGGGTVPLQDHEPL